MILINVRFHVRREFVDSFLQRVDSFTQATRAEPGCLFFDWYRSAEAPDEFILVEGFLDDAAEAHVSSEHFRQACVDVPKLLVSTPTIINTLIPGKVEWDRMAEFKVAE